MTIQHLNINQYRNLLSVKINPNRTGFNLLFGKNGSGKTSLLEAIYYLALGRSFRSSLTRRIINHQADHFSLFAEIMSNNQQIIPLGIERHCNSELKIRIAGKNAQSLAELVEIMPVQFINADCCQLLTGGPQLRRKYLDWGVFHYKQDFLTVWRDFHRVLKQRNIALRNFASKEELASWSKRLSQHALILDEYRRDYVAHLLPTFKAILAELMNDRDFDIRYDSGWTQSIAYEELLSQALPRDFQLGYTEYGPHKADFKALLNGVPIKDILSRGQQKLFVCGMILAQGILLQKHTNKTPIYLIDDMSSELDLISKNKFITQLSAQKAQIFVTAVERDVLENRELPVKVFHVEQGNITEFVAE